MLGMASPIDARDNSKLNQRRLLYPIIGSGNASQFENQHERLTMMRKSSVRKDARSNISSSPEKTRRGELPCGTKAAFFKSVREQLQDPTMSDVLKNNVLASLLTALTSKKLAFVDLSGYDVSGSYLFYNHVMKPVDGKALIHVSPLIGFVEQSASAEVHSDLLSERDFLDVNKLEEGQRNRAYTDCYWTGSVVVNIINPHNHPPRRNETKNQIKKSR